MSNLLSVEQASERLGVSVSLLYQMVSKKVIRCYRVGVKRGAIRFSEDQLLEYLGTRQAGISLTAKHEKPKRIRLQHIK